MNKLRVFLSIAVFLCAASCQEKGKELPHIKLAAEWLKCSEDSECTVIREACRSCKEIIVLNKSFEALFLEADRIARERVGFNPLCEACNLSAVRPICLNGRCSTGPDTVSATSMTNVPDITIPEGFRAVTVRSVWARERVEAHTDIRVDVIWDSVVQGRASTTVIVRDVQVLSVAQHGGPNLGTGAKIVTSPSRNHPPTPETVPLRTPMPDAEETATITLLVSNNDARKIQLASTIGSLRVSLTGELYQNPGSVLRTYCDEQPAAPLCAQPNF
jgi:hypothetical protein